MIFRKLTKVLHEPNTSRGVGRKAKGGPGPSLLALPIFDGLLLKILEPSFEYTSLKAFVV